MHLEIPINSRKERREGRKKEKKVGREGKEGGEESEGNIGKKRAFEDGECCEPGGGGKRAGSLTLAGPVAPKGMNGCKVRKFPAGFCPTVNFP